MAGIKRKKLRRTWQRWSILGAVIFILAVVGFRWTANAPVMPSQEKEYALYVHDTGLTTAEVLQSFFCKRKFTFACGIGSAQCFKEKSYCATRALYHYGRNRADAIATKIGIWL